MNQLLLDSRDTRYVLFEMLAVDKLNLYEKYSGHDPSCMAMYEYFRFTKSKMCTLAATGSVTMILCFESVVTLAGCSIYGGSFR